MPGNLDNDDVIKQLPNDDQQEDEDEKDEKKQKQSQNEQVQNHKKMLEQYRLKEHEHETSMFEKSLQQVEIPFKGIWIFSLEKLTVRFEKLTYRDRFWWRKWPWQRWILLPKYWVRGT